MGKQKHAEKLKRNFLECAAEETLRSKLVTSCRRVSVVGSMPLSSKRGMRGIVTGWNSRISGKPMCGVPSIRPRLSKRGGTILSLEREIVLPKRNMANSRVRLIYFRDVRLGWFCLGTLYRGRQTLRRQGCSFESSSRGGSVHPEQRSFVAVVWLVNLCIGFG